MNKTSYSRIWILFWKAWIHFLNLPNGLTNTSMLKTNSSLWDMGIWTAILLIKWWCMWMTLSTHDSNPWPKELKSNHRAETGLHGAFGMIHSRCSLGRASITKGIVGHIVGQFLLRKKVSPVSFQILCRGRTQLKKNHYSTRVWSRHQRHPSSKVSLY